MPIPPTRYIDAGPAMPQASASAAALKGEAMARMGATIQAVGGEALNITEKMIKAEEGAKISNFIRTAEEEAASFSNDLMRRSDTEKWKGDWNETLSGMRSRVHSLGLSPEGKTRAQEELEDFASKRTIRLETQAASKALELARHQYTSDADYYFRRGEIEKGKKTIDNGVNDGVFSDTEREEAYRRGAEIEAEVALGEDIQTDPQGTLARLESGEFLEASPGADLALVERGKRMAQAKIQELRGSEMDTLEAAAMTGQLKERDIKEAKFITDRDRAALTGSLAQDTPPSNEEHANAWKILTDLREARSDPAMDADEYRKLWNESRSSLLQRISPRWQGDLKKELSYLSPAGRSASGGSLTTGYTREDLEAVGRGIAFRARDAGFFGTIDEDAPPADREKAFRKAEDIRLEVKRWLSTQREPTPEKVREYTDSLISGDRIKSTARELQSFVPGTAQRLRVAPPMPQLPPKQGAKDKETEDPLNIQPGNSGASDAQLPARKQLETFINQ